MPTPGEVMMSVQLDKAVQAEEVTRLVRFGPPGHRRPVDLTAPAMTQGPASAARPVTRREHLQMSAWKYSRKGRYVCHELGHAIVCLKLAPDALRHAILFDPKDRLAGVTIWHPELVTDDADRLAVWAAGAAAERLYFGSQPDPFTFVSDLRKAHPLAARLMGIRDEHMRDRPCGPMVSLILSLDDVPDSPPWKDALSAAQRIILSNRRAFLMACGELARRERLTRAELQKIVDSS